MDEIIMMSADWQCGIGSVKMYSAELFVLARDWLEPGEGYQAGATRDGGGGDSSSRTEKVGN